MTHATSLGKTALGVAAIIVAATGLPVAQIEPDDIYWHDLGIPGPPFGEVTEMTTIGTDLWVAGFIGSCYVDSSTDVSTIARWDGTSWTMVGSQIDGEVHALYEYNGDVYAGGRFDRIDDVPVKSIARWDGSNWNPLAGGITEHHSNTSDGVLTFLEYGGMLWVGGYFDEVDGVTRPNLAAWDGSAWHSHHIYYATSGWHVAALAVYEGELIAAGRFELMSGGQTYHSVARYDTDPLIGWQAMGNPNGTTNALAVYDGTLIAGGSYNDLYLGVVYWTGTNWAELGWRVDGWGDGVIDFVGYGGDLFLSCDGWLHLPGDPPEMQRYPVVGWNGEGFYSAGTVVSGGPGFLAVYSDLLSSGGVITPGQQSGVIISRWAGNDWLPLGPGMEGSFYALTYVVWGIEEPIQLYAAGDFHYHDDLIDTRDIIQWDGSSWVDVGSGTDGSILAMHSVPGIRASTSLFVGGSFSTIDGVPASNVASCNHTSWSALGTGIDGTVISLCAGPDNHEVVAGGVFSTAGGVSCNNIAWWHDGAWHAMGSGLDGPVTAMARSGDDLVVVGGFTTAGGISSPRIARWDGTEWHAMIPPVHPEAERLGYDLNFTTVIPTYGRLPFGDGFLLGSMPVGLDYVPWPGVSTWKHGLAATDGTSWCVRTDLQSAYERDFIRWYGCELISCTIPNAISIKDASVAPEELPSSGFLQRWDGETWYNMGTGVEAYGTSPVLTDMIAFDGLIVAGSFTMAGGKFANGLARWDRPETDADGDGTFYGCDNCIHDHDPFMTDTDADGIGDVCDQCPGMDLCDNDFDGFPGGCDNCPEVANDDQADLDGDGIGDICDDCCLWRVGDANGLGGDEPTIGDVSVLIDAKFITGSCDGILECLTEADINQSGGADPTCDDITIGDISTLIDYLFITGSSLGLADCL